jgi:hypothetical protein
VIRKFDHQILTPIADRLQLHYLWIEKLGTGAAAGVNCYRSAMSEFVDRENNVLLPTRVVNGLHVFDPPPGSPIVTSKKVMELQDSET